MSALKGLMSVLVLVPLICTVVLLVGLVDLLRGELG